MQPESLDVNVFTCLYFPKPASIKRKLEKSINMSSWWQSALESGGTTFHYRLQGPLISFQSTLWKQQNVIMFSGCIQHYIATIYFHFICLSNTGASAGNWFRLERVSVHEKSSFSPLISREPWHWTTLNGSLEQLHFSPVTL